jgi:hypothetical protein
MIRIAIVLVLLSATFAFTQEQSTPESKPPDRALISPLARLKAAKTMYVKNLGATDIPYNVIENGLEAWPRFVIVDSPDQADVILQVEAPDTSPQKGNDDGQIGKVKHQVQIDTIKLTVLDAHSHLPLWSSVEHPRDSFREKTRDDNLVEASEKLFARLHDRVEPPPADAASKDKKE